MDDMLAALTRRVAELEERLATTTTDLQAERERLVTYGASERPLDEAAADRYRSADAILQRARAEADDTLTTAADERRALLNDVARLRDERDDLHAEITSLRSGEPSAVEVETPRAFLQTAIVNEMRALLIELAADFRARLKAPADVEAAVSGTVDVARDDLVNPRLLDDLDEPALVVAGEPVVDEYVEDLRGSRQSA